MEVKSIEGVFKYLKTGDNYKEAIKRRVCKIILGSSVIRAFEKDTKDGLIDCLLRIDVSGLYTISSEKMYDEWHSEKVKIVKSYLCKTNKVNFADSQAGLMWGHATKVFNLYMGHLVYYSPYYGNAQYIERVYSYLHVPLDSKVFKILKEFGVQTPKTIKKITKKQYYEIQSLLREIAKGHKIAPLAFDEYAWATS